MESKETSQMRYGFLKLAAAIGLLLATWGLSSFREAGEPPWVRPGGGVRGVRILQFYANVGTVRPGQPATLCYGVENAKSVRISPLLPGTFPSARHCLEVFPEHTTHYTILAEGYDGAVATRSLTLPVTARPSDAPRYLQFASIR